MREKCECVSQKNCCEREGCGEVVDAGARFFFVEESGGQEGDLEHRLCRDCVRTK